MNVVSSRQISTDSALLTIDRTGVTANIDGGYNRTVSTSQEILIDASTSQDIDYPGSELSFTWTCLVISPNFGDLCGDFNNPGLPVLRIKPFFFNISIVNITVLVSNLAGFSSSSVCQVNVINQVTPTVQIIGVSNKYNPGSVIILTGLVSIMNDSAVTQWSSSKALNLSSIAATSLIKVVNGVNTPFQLAIVPNTLLPGLQYTFQLQAFYLSHPSGIATSSVIITINVAPMNGILEVSPSQGIALSTPYFFLTSRWSDDVNDLPLKYVFAYAATSQTRITILRSLDSIQYMTSYLGIGLRQKIKKSLCIAIAYDIFNAGSNVTTMVEVNPASSAVVIFDNSQALIKEALIARDSSLALSLISTTMISSNDVDCQVPYDCHYLNRAACSATPRTCGSCLFGFIGVIGDANLPCVQKNSTKSLLGDFCHSNTSCFSGLCTSSHCQDVSKSCVNNCGGKGICTYYDRYGSILSSCSVTDIYCSAACLCRNNSFGIDCSMSRQQYTQSSAFKSTACEAILASVKNQDVSVDVVMSRISAVNSILNDGTAIDSLAISNCTSAVLMTVINNPATCCQESLPQLIVETLSNVIALRIDMSMSMFDGILNVMSSLLSGCQQFLPISEKTVSRFNSESISAVTSLIASNDLLSKQFMTPQSDFELLLGYPAPMLSMSYTNSNNLLLNSNNIVLGISLIQYKTNNHVQSSNSPMIRIETVLSPSSGRFNRRKLSTATLVGFHATLVIPNTHQVTYNSLIAYNETYNCLLISPVEYLVSSTVCSSTVNKNVTCPPNERGIITIACPGFNTMPLCSTWNKTNYTSSSVCEVVQYTSYNTTCKCSVGVVTSKQSALEIAVLIRKEQSSPSITVSFDRFQSIIPHNNSIVVYITLYYWGGVFALILVFLFISTNYMIDKKKLIPFNSVEKINSYRTIQHFSYPISGLIA